MRQHGGRLPNAGPQAPSPDTQPHRVPRAESTTLEKDPSEKLKSLEWLILSTVFSGPGVPLEQQRGSKAADQGRLSRDFPSPSGDTRQSETVSSGRGQRAPGQPERGP